MQLQGPALASPAAPLNELLAAGLARAPDETAMVSIVRSMTWRELDRESAAVAAGYRALGCNEGDRLASLMPNRIDLAVHYLACFKAGLVATPLNYRYTFREIDHALEVSGADALLVHVEREEDVAASRWPAACAAALIAYRDEPGDGDAGVDWPHDFAALLEAEPLVYDPSPDPTIPAAIFFTSGSTGPGQGRDPHARVAAVDDRQRGGRVRARCRATCSSRARRCRTSARSCGR